MGGWGAVTRKGGIETDAPLTLTATRLFSYGSHLIHTAVDVGITGMPLVFLQGLQ